MSESNECTVLSDVGQVVDCRLSTGNHAASGADGCMPVATSVGASLTTRTKVVQIVVVVVVEKAGQNVLALSDACRGRAGSPNPEIMRLSFGRSHYDWRRIAPNTPPFTLKVAARLRSHNDFWPAGHKVPPEGYKFSYPVQNCPCPLTSIRGVAAHGLATTTFLPDL